MVVDSVVESSLESSIICIEKILECCDNIGNISSNFQQSSLPILYNSVNSIVENIRKLNSHSTNLSKIVIPMDVLNLVDRGRNPELFAGNYLKEAFKASEKLKDKLTVYKYFIVQLIREMEIQLPEVYSEYIESTPVDKFIGLYPQNDENL